MKKYIKYTILVVSVILLVLVKGNVFGLIDMVIVRPIANILFIIYNLIGDFGSAIILFTILVKLCMWPLVKKQLHQTKVMRKIQPELVEIKKNCNGNRQLESLQTMDLYKRYNIKPFSSIFTILIQFPIFIALYTAIRVMVVPTPTDNLSLRAYSFVQYEDSRTAEVVKLQEPHLTDKENTPYNFHPKLFGVVELDQKPGLTSPSSICILFFAVLAAYIQYLVTKQQQGSGKNKNKKKFRDLVKKASSGEEVSQAEMNEYTAGQISTIMPIMMFFIIVMLPGALVFYYLLSNIISAVQQKIVLSQAEKEMEISADKAIIKELKNIKEAEVIENKKTGTKITRISAKDSKKKRR